MLETFEPYKHLSIKYSDPEKYTESSINERISTKFIEAEGYRNNFSATTLTRLRWSELVGNDKDSPLSVFWERMPRQVFMHVIMYDFYRDIPTTVETVLNKIGTRNGSRIIRESIDNNLVIRFNHEADHRVKLLAPSIKMVVAYEKRGAKWEFRRIVQEGRLDESKIIKELKNFDRLRRIYFPKFLYDLADFHLEGRAEAAIEPNSNIGFIKFHKNHLSN